MSDSSVCVGCLVTDVKMHSMSSSGLFASYQQLTGLQNVDPYEISQKLCWECAALVNKFNAFRLKCERAHTLLQDTYMMHGEISKQSVQDIDRLSCKLTSSYSTIVLESYDITKDSQHIDEKEKDSVSLKEELYDDDTPLVHLKNNRAFEETKEAVKDENSFHEGRLLDDEVQNDDSDDDSDRDEGKKKVKKKKVTRGKVGKKIDRKVENKKKENDDVSEFATVVTLTEEQQIEEIKNRQDTASYKEAFFKCTLCYKGFVHETAYKNHMKRHDASAGTYECAVCKMRFKSKRLKTNHVYKVHSVKYMCKGCPFVSQCIEQARNHQKWHNGVVYKCDICDEQFMRKSTFQSHRRIKHTSEDACPLCGESFVSRLGLAQHQSRFHKDDPPVKEYQARCEECGIDFATTQALNRHLVISPRHKTDNETSNGCRDCGLTFATAKDLQSHRNKEHRRLKVKTDSKNNLYPIKCAHCDIMVSSGQEYWKHFRRTHPTEVYPAIKPAVCELCGKSFKDKVHLRIHNYMHTGEKPYKCDTCTKCYSSPNALRLHKRTHSNDTPWKCDICGQGFTNSSNMYRHQTVHTDAKPFKCETCGKRFKYRITARQHIEYVHMKKPLRRKITSRTIGKLDMKDLTSTEDQPEATYERYSVRTSDREYRILEGESSTTEPALAHEEDNEPASCRQCGKQLISNRAYLIHLRRHHPDAIPIIYPNTKTPAMCEQCGKIFQDKVHLRLHMFIHTGERPYKCEVCNKSYNSPGTLKIHRRTHTKELPYRCDVCGQGFTNSSNMYRHQVVHTDAKPFSCDTCGKRFKYQSTAKQHVEYVHMKKAWPKRDRNKQSAKSQEETFLAPQL